MAKQVKALLLLTGTVLFWGSSFAVTKDTYAELSPMAVMSLRMLIASLAFLPFWWRLPRPQYRRGDAKLLALSMAFIPCAYFLLESLAMLYTTSSQAGVISATVPLIVALGAWLLFRERLTWQQGVGVAVSITMVVVLAMTGTSQASAPMPWLGNLLELGAMVAAAGSMLTIKQLSSRYHPWFLTGLQAASGAVFFTVMAAATGGWPSLGGLSVPVMLELAYLGVFPGLLAFGLYNSALKMMPATSAALAINLIPVVAVLTGWLLLGESLTVVQLLACALIIAAVVFAEVSSATGDKTTLGESDTPVTAVPDTAPAATMATVDPASARVDEPRGVQR